MVVRLKNIRHVIFGVLLLIISEGHAQHDTVWTRRLSGTGNGNDQIRAMTADPQGNVYVAVQNDSLPGARSAVIVAKYSPSGDVLWSRRFTGAACSVPAGIALDRWQNVFVVASCGDGQFTADIVTVKYTTSGDSCWVRSFDAQGEWTDSAAAVVADTAGNVYVAGTSFTIPGGYGCTLLRYSGSGDLDWAQLFHAGRDTYCFAAAMTYDTSGCIYVGGNAGGSYLTLKYSLAGDLQWSRIVPNRGHDKITAIALDGQHNLLATGQTKNFQDGDSSGVMTVKYSPEGETLWTRRRMALGRLNGAVAVQADGDDNVVVAGRFRGSSYSYFEGLVAKYSWRGSELWWSVAGDGDSLTALQVATNGDIYVAGFRQIPIHMNVWVRTAKYSADGEEVWSRDWIPYESLLVAGTPLLLWHYGAGTNLLLTDSLLYVGGCYRHWNRDTNVVLLQYDLGGKLRWKRTLSGPGGNSDAAYDVKFDGQGNVIVAGCLDNTNEAADLAVAKYSQDGTLSWQRTYRGIQGGEDGARKVQTDADGNVYVLGYSEGDSTGLDFVTIKYDATGNQRWVRRYDGPAHGTDVPVGLTVDRAGNVIVTGASQGIGTEADFATVKYSPTGQELWARRYNGLADSADQPGGITVDTAGNVYVSGKSRESGNWHPATTIKYDPGGTVVWTTQCEDPEPRWSDFDIAGIGIGPDGGVYLGGFGIYYIAAKLSPAGETLWVRSAQSDFNPLATSATVDALGRVIVTGYGGPGYLYDYVTVAFGPTGSELWRRSYDRGTGDDDAAFGIAAGPDGRIFVTGVSEAPLTVWDAVTVGYDSSGRQVWVGAFASPGAGLDWCYAVVADSANRVAVAGYAQNGTASWDFLTILYSPQEGIGESARLRPLAPRISLDAQPNPFYQRVEFRTRAPEGQVSLGIYDPSGRLVRSLLNRVPCHPTLVTTWDGSDNAGRPTASGIYFARVVWAGGKDPGLPSEFSACDASTKIVKR